MLAKIADWATTKFACLLGIFVVFVPLGIWKAVELIF